MRMVALILALAVAGCGTVVRTASGVVTTAADTAVDVVTAPLP